MQKRDSMEKISNNYYLLGVTFLQVAPYGSFTQHQQILTHQHIPKSYKYFGFPYIYFMMVIWSIVKCIKSDPGYVRIFYGVLLDDYKQKKRHYCLIFFLPCFKPERFHNCKICVLNLDYHCPLIGNCVGYKNRKFLFCFFPRQIQQSYQDLELSPSKFIQKLWILSLQIGDFQKFDSV
ncbi:unnamed protein product (macronuclear) [Paramecium tetraurelia]|uniref:Palmitoyltransferase n=1 Tax=Paramecium tetraurelia TaxID=5888 RepID=A0BRI6_PARTE|nr:uncharacterized protein GSPATT00031384001 [Paramecium tetraurelia]CAK61153.1 unnamed protein product [Paramecium tetraurelia]|eukprot:XP_001428551.1 hypothetical protein (macronuclear) [Paramecium tetraurelia strain d4-2]